MPSPGWARAPYLPDMVPVVGKAPRHAGLWFDFGHQHRGLTLGPTPRRWLAEMITGETPFTDPKPYAVERFGRPSFADWSPRAARAACVAWPVAAILKRAFEAASRSGGHES